MQSMSSIAMMPLSRTLGRREMSSGMPLPPLFDRHGEFLLDFLAEIRARVVRTERDHLAVGGRVVDHAALHPLDVVVVVVLEVHAANLHRTPAVLCGALLVALRDNPITDLHTLTYPQVCRVVIILYLILM